MRLSTNTRGRAHAAPRGGGEDYQDIPFVAISDYAGREMQIASFGDMVIGAKDPDLMVTFNYFINPDRVIDLSTSNGALSIDARRLKVGVNGGAGTAIAESRAPIIYRTGHDAFGMYTCAYDDWMPGTTQEAGIFNTDNGYKVVLEEDGLHVQRMSGGSLKTDVPQADWNIDPLDGTGISKLTINPQALLIYKISYGFLGVLPPIFEVYGGVDFGWIPFHAIDDMIDRTEAGIITLGKNNSLIIEDPFLPVQIKATSDGVNNVNMFSGSWLGGVICSERKRSTNDQYSFSVSGDAPQGEIILGTGRVKAMFQGEVNKIPLDLHTLTAGVDGTKPHVINVYRNSNLENQVYQDLIGSDSITEVDLAGNFVGGTPSGRLITSVSLGRVSDLGSGFPYDSGEARIFPGETHTFTLVNSSASATAYTAAVHWDELK